MDDEAINPADLLENFDINYNCHSHAWHGGRGDSNGNDPMVPPGSGPRWDNSPIDDFPAHGPLNPKSPKDRPRPGDIVVYVFDKNHNGKVDNYKETTHSAVVTRIDANGNVVAVESKFGNLGLGEHHPNDPWVVERNGRPTFIFRITK